MQTGAMITSMNPRTGAPAGEELEETSPEEVAARCREAAQAAAGLEALGRHGRARMLQAMADALEARRQEAVALADLETALGGARLEGELTRTTFQLRFFAEVLEDGAYLEATIDHAGPSPMGPRPDLRRLLRPLGPVAVFGASNFPFAFSVPGGDTASALAAGCPVVVKGHEAHPRTSLLCAEALAEGAARSGAGEHAVAVVLGVEAGRRLVLDPSIAGVGFTGSLAGGRLLHELAATRPSPIPFYGELGALNALIVCPGAAAQRPEEIAAGLSGSFTLGAGQFCTKPGLALVPAGPAGDALVAALAAEVASKPSQAMLSARVANGFLDGSGRLRQVASSRALAEGRPPDSSEGWWSTPLLLEVGPGALEGTVLEECFGPVLVLVRYASGEQLLQLVDRLGPALAAAVHAEVRTGPDGLGGEDASLAADLLERLTRKVGRIVWNGYPTGVAVSWAMHHGGPYPATTDPLHSSVGASAIRRWLRPVAYQDVPEALLPPEVRDELPAGERLLRRVDGRTRLA